MFESQNLTREIFVNVFLVDGNLGNDIELKTTEGGKKVCNFSIAESFRTSKKDENGKAIYDTRWHNVTAWDGLAQKMADFAVKGQPLIVRGYVDYDEYKKDNKDYKTVNIVADDINLYSRFDYAERKKSNERKAPASEPQWQQ